MLPPTGSLMLMYSGILKGGEQGELVSHFRNLQYFPSMARVCLPSPSRTWDPAQATSQTLSGWQCSNISTSQKERVYLKILKEKIQESMLSLLMMSKSLVIPFGMPAVPFLLLVSHIENECYGKHRRKQASHKIKALFISQKPVVFYSHYRPYYTEAGR